MSNGSVTDGHEYDWATPDVRAPSRSWPLAFVPDQLATASTITATTNSQKRFVFHIGLRATGSSGEKIFMATSSWECWQRCQNRGKAIRFRNSSGSFATLTAIHRTRSINSAAMKLASYTSSVRAQVRQILLQQRAQVIAELDQHFNPPQPPPEPEPIAADDGLGSPNIGDEGFNPRYWL